MKAFTEYLTEKIDNTKIEESNITIGGWENLKAFFKKQRGFDSWVWEGDYDELVIKFKKNIQAIKALQKSNNSTNEISAYGDVEAGNSEIRLYVSKEAKQAMENGGENIGEADETNYKNIIRYVPSSAKIKTELTPKGLKIHIIDVVSAPPLVTSDVKGIETRMFKDVNNLIDDIESVIKVKTVSKDKYIFLEGKEGAIWIHYEFSLSVGSVAEGKKLKKLDDALAFYKKRKTPFTG